MSDTFDITRKLQWQVSDPSTSAWVNANAGSGKTHVLSQRVLRLLLAGTDPASILCLTFTKAASAEMGRRIFDRLGNWAVMPADDLKRELLELQGEPPQRSVVSAARSLFARALDTPGGLKIQTMHAFCESLLHLFPFEANVPGHFQVLDEQGSDVLLKQAREAVFAGLGPEGTAPRDALSRLIGRHTDSTLIAALNDVIRKRALIEDWMARSAPEGRAGTMDDVFAGLRQAFSLDSGDDAETVSARFLADNRFQLIDAHRQALVAALAANPGSRNDKAQAKIGQVTKAVDASARAEAIVGFYLVKARTKANETTVTDAVRSCIAGFDDMFRSDADLCLSLVDDLNGLTAVENTEALMALGAEILKLYHAAKDRQGLLDYDDLIARTGGLLSRSEAAAWVLYRLDSRIDHILIDEAQDTSPAQWAIIRALSEDFFAGEGASAKYRTIFAVGDDKQSIYSFQGAAPQMLTDMRRHFARRSEQAERRMIEKSLFLSFRSTRQVLDAVDAVFGRNEAMRESVTGGQYESHSERRIGERGQVIIWPRLVALAEDPPDDWTSAYDAPTEVDTRLAGGIADEIRRLLDEERRLPSGKPVVPGEILILVRKRDAFFVAMNRALRSAGIATAGTDRIAVSSHIAVLDCLALADVMLLPDDDLQLAACLKSPIVGLDDDDLIALAPRREGSLWRSLASSTVPEHCEAYRRLSEWRAVADRITPFQFFSRILGPNGARAALRSRLGSEADDVLDAFLSQALAHERLETPSLQGFVAHIRAQTGDLKRESDERATTVRIMTVHGAKGLEADIVFLVDTGGQIVNTSRKDPLLKIGDPAAPALVMRQAMDRASRIERKYGDDEAGRATDEYRRLLYVGMTRARDVLNICGIRRAREPEGNWYALAAGALLPETVEHDDDGELTAPFVWPDMLDRDGDRDSRRRPAAEPGARADSGEPAPQRPLASELPVWLTRPAAPPPLVPAPLRPSRALAEPDLPADVAVAAAAEEALGGADLGAAVQRGQAIHALLQYLPDLPASHRLEAARRWLMHHYPQAVTRHADWLDEAMAVLDHADLAGLFGRGSRAEVPVAGYVETTTGRHAVSGQIDRLIIDGRAARIVDFKTDRRIPKDSADIPAAYVTQMALYHRLVGNVPGLTAVTAVLAWTAGPRAIELTEIDLESALEAIGVLPATAA